MLLLSTVPQSMNKYLTKSCTKVLPRSAVPQWMKERGIFTVFQGSTLEKKPWGQLAPKFIDLVASTNILVAKNFRPFGPKIFT